jgi:hypothetical protein
VFLIDVPVAVAKATGEDLRTIMHRGFGVVGKRSTPANDPGAYCLWLDCPFCGSPALLSAEGPERMPEIAECERCDTVFDYSNADVYTADPLDVLEADSGKRAHERAA